MSFGVLLYLCVAEEHNELLDRTKGILGKTKTKQKDCEEIHVEKNINSKCNEKRKNIIIILFNELFP